MTAEAQILAGVAKVEAAAAFLTSPFLVAQLVEGMQAAVIASQSPWLNRKDAAAYARCSTSEIDRAASLGILRRHERGGTPIFERTGIDAAIRDGKWIAASKAARATCK